MDTSRKALMALRAGSRKIGDLKSPILPRFSFLFSFTLPYSQNPYPYTPMSVFQVWRIKAVGWHHLRGIWAGAADGYSIEGTAQLQGRTRQPAGAITAPRSHSHLPPSPSLAGDPSPLSSVQYSLGFFSSYGYTNRNYRKERRIPCY